jgi:hypothetical protein
MARLTVSTERGVGCGTRQQPQLEVSAIGERVANVFNSELASTEQDRAAKVAAPYRSSPPCLSMTDLWATGVVARAATRAATHKRARRPA